ncbi:hypothetical protein ACFL0U_04250 [Pseudomonadota bacterium]
MNKLFEAAKRVTRGEEELKKVLWFWGVIPILIELIIIERFIYTVNIPAIEVLLGILILIYFIWHLVVIRKSIPECKLSRKERKELKRQRKEEKKRLKKEKKTGGPKDFFGSFMRKLLLKEPWGKFNLTRVVAAGDLLVITTHLLNVSVNLR